MKEFTPEQGKAINEGFFAVLEENYQAQIAGFYNDDKTDEERKIRNAVIEEYQDLIAIFKTGKWREQPTENTKEGSMTFTIDQIRQIWKAAEEKDIYEDGSCYETVEEYLKFRGWGKEQSIPPVSEKWELTEADIKKIMVDNIVYTNGSDGFTQAAKQVWAIITDLKQTIADRDKQIAGISR